MSDVTIIIPTHNRADWLEETIDSAKKAGASREIIVVDDASTDRTPELCRALAGIRYIRLEENVGASEARNIGVRESLSDLIAFLDDDDLRLPDSLDAQVDLLRRSPEAALVYGPALLGDARYSLPIGWVVPVDRPAGDVYWTLLQGNFIPTSSVVIRKRALIDVGLFDTGLDTLEDYDLWVRLAERHSMVAVADPVAIYRVRSVTSGQKTSDRANHERRHRELHARMLRSPRARAAPWRQRRNVHRHHMGMIYSSLIHDAALALVSGDPKATGAYLRAAVRMRPLHIKAHVSLLWLFARNLRQSIGRA